jgi:hypothetical protein
MLLLSFLRLLSNFILQYHNKSNKQIPVNAATASNAIIPHPMLDPAFRCLPDFVVGMPVFLDILDLAFDTPVARFHEKPPLFAIFNTSINLYLC